MLRLLSYCSIFLFLTACSEKKNTIMAVASSNYSSSLEIAADYQKETGEKVDVIKGSSGKLYHQILKGAPYDVFISANEDYCRKLVDKLNLDESNLEFIGYGDLAACTKDNSSQKNIEQRICSGEFKTIVIPNPVSAPYGKQALNYLKSLNCFDKIESSLVYAKSVSATNNYLNTGNAELVITAMVSLPENLKQDVVVLPKQFRCSHYVLTLTDEGQKVVNKITKNKAIASNKTN